MLDAPTCWRQVMFALLKLCGPNPGKSRLNAAAARLSDWRTPESHRGCCESFSWGEHPGIGTVVLEFFDPRLVPRRQTTQRQDPLALVGLRHVDVATPVALGDLDGAHIEVHILDPQTRHFGDARPGIQ